MTIKLEKHTFPGEHISKACEKAAALAKEKGEPVEFDFNGVIVVVDPGEDGSAAVERFHRDSAAAHEAYLASPEYAQRKREEEEEHARKCAAHLSEAATTEQEMRAAKVPWPYTKEQLVEYIDSLVEREHDYGTCVYAMSMAAVAAFYFVSHKLGVTGFQASCAEMDFLRRTRHLEGPFMLIDAEKMLYPQYNPMVELLEALEKWRPWAKKRAAELLAERTSACDAVVERWKQLANDPEVS